MAMHLVSVSELEVVRYKVADDGHDTGWRLKYKDASICFEWVMHCCGRSGEDAERANRSDSDSGRRMAHVEICGMALNYCFR